MKRLFLFISILLISWSAFGQAVTQTGFVGKFSFQSFSAGGSSDVTGTLDAFSDQTNQYFANNIQVADVIWDNQGGRWEVMAVNSSNLLQADVDLRSVNGAGGTPFGVGFVSRETSNMGLSLFVPDNNIGISQQLKSRIESHNMLLIDQYVASNQDSVFTGATAADTTTVSDPTIGDVLVADNGDVGYYDGDSWVVSSGGSSTWLDPELQAGDVTISSPNKLTLEDPGSNFLFAIQDPGALPTNSINFWKGGFDIGGPVNSYLGAVAGNLYFGDTGGDVDLETTQFDAPDLTDVIFGNFYFNTGQDVSGTTGYVLTDTGGGYLELQPAGGGADGNGIYSGSGTVPDSTGAQLTDTFVFLGDSEVSAEVEGEPIVIGSDFIVGKQAFTPGTMNFIEGVFQPDSVVSWGWKNSVNGPFGIALSEFWFNPMSGVYGRYEFEDFAKAIHQDNVIGSFKYMNNDSGDSLYYHLGLDGMEQSYYDNGDSSKFEFRFNQVDLDFQDGNNRFLLTRDANISLTANTGFTATTTSGILGLTHTGSSGQLIVQSQDERATFQGEEARIIGDTLARMTVGSGQSLIKDALVDLTAGSSDFATLDGSINEFRVGTHDIVFEGTDGFYPEWKFQTPVAANDWRFWSGAVGLTIQNGTGGNTVVIANNADAAVSVAQNGDVEFPQYDQLRHDTETVWGNYQMDANGKFLRTFDGEFNFRDDALATASNNTSTVIMNNTSMELPSALTNAGKMFIVIANASTSGGTPRPITVAGGGTIEGNASLSMDNAYEVYALISNGTEYVILWNKP